MVHAFCPNWDAQTTAQEVSLSRNGHYRDGTALELLMLLCKRNPRGWI